jgi:hypothetical protein
MSTETPTAKTRRNPSLREQADRLIDKYYDWAKKRASLLSNSFPLREGNISAQVRNLQQVTLSATRFADIEDFIKNQVGKEFSKGSRTRPWGTVGPELLDQLEELRGVQALQPGAAEDEKAAPEDQLKFRLMLARGWVRSLVSEYLYLAATSTRGGHHP